MASETLGWRLRDCCPPGLAQSANREPPPVAGYGWFWTWGGRGGLRVSPAGEPPHLPFPWGTVLGALGALLPPPAALASGTAELGRAFVRRPLRGRSRLRGSVFRPFSWRALLVILTFESCRERKRKGVLFPLRCIPAKEEPALGVLGAVFCTQVSSAFLPPPALNHSSSPFLSFFFFLEILSSELFDWGWLGTAVLISASRVARIRGVSRQCLAQLCFSDSRERPLVGNLQEPSF